MLVLSRKQDETIWIDDRICIRVLKATGRDVRLGIEAPREIDILRGELRPQFVGSKSGRSPRDPSR